MTNKAKIAINGFGRIGRATFKIITAEFQNLEIVAINDLTDTKMLAHLLKYDSCYGVMESKIEGGVGFISVDGRKFKVTAEKEPVMLPWKAMGVDIVLECTGRFTSAEGAGGHIKAGAKKVIISAPAKSGDVKTFVIGVNEDKIKKTDKIISNASCTTNCLAPVTEVIRHNFGIEKALMTTIHSYTADQNLVDGPHKDPRRARAAAVSMVPTTTGAAIAVSEVIPSLRGSFDGLAVRVPTPTGSMCDVVFVTKKKVDEKMVNAAIKAAAKSTKLRGIIEASEDQIVSIDIVGNPASSIVDLPLTKVVGGNLVKIIAWYDNEWGYANRLVDLAALIAKKKLL